MLRLIAALGVVLAMSMPVRVLGRERVPLVGPEVRDAVCRGSARVIVELRITSGFRAEGDLPSPNEIAAQRSAIAAGQAGVLPRLSGSRFMLSLEIGPGALAMLETLSDLVSRVRPDATPRRMSLQPSFQ